jgi:GT2 family glycosyltransferase
MNYTAIVILNYNNITDTINCIDSVLKHTDSRSVKIFVIDNASEKTTYQEVKEYLEDKNALCINSKDKEAIPEDFPSITYLRNDINYGYANGNNSALHLIDKDRSIDKVMILNNDTLFTEDIITPLATYLDQHEDCGIVAPLLYGRTGDIDRECARKEKTLGYFMTLMPLFGHIDYFKKKAQECYISLDKVQEKDILATQLISGACFMMRKSVFSKIGYFASGTFLYFEEDILWKKIQRLGMYNCVLPKYSCIHLGANSTSKSSSFFILKCHVESMIYYLKGFSSFDKFSILFMTTLAKLSLKIKTLKA